MKKHIVRHGEVVLKQIDSLPKEAKLQKEVNKEIVAHSETGHHHVLETIDMSKMKFYVANGETYIEVPSMASLWHQKTGKDVHTPHKIIPGFYKINIKKSYNYFSKLLERVRD
jgi:hypothetical protein